MAILLAIVLAVASCAQAVAAPQVRNHSFEADTYATYPGAARVNGAKITGWEWKGNCGVNPFWRNPDGRTGPASPFHDNGKTPHGRQLALIQGKGRLSQEVAGFEAGHKYMVVYRENARVQRQGNLWPVVRVTLGGKLIVSAHEVTPVSKQRDFQVPFYRVESGVFTAPAAGAFRLVIETVQESQTTTILLDNVQIVEVPAR